MLESEVILHKLKFFTGSEAVLLSSSSQQGKQGKN